MIKSEKKLMFNAITADKKYCSYLKSKIIRFQEIIACIENRDASFPPTCLTIIKKLCSDRNICIEFMGYLADKSYQYILSENTCTELKNIGTLVFNELLDLRAGNTSAENTNRILRQAINYQNVTKSGCYGALIRTIKSRYLYILEVILNCYINININLQYYTYDITRIYIEEYDSSKPYGINYKSLKHLKEILFFWETLYTHLKTE